ncbi:MAG: hypothetical protein QOI74_1783 [Micromonosporaceae bacterium]|nr:hypothetical protein [Micromonosporaceae bacterium]MDT5037030.1 hypothetical protein [Micromonosporaceae bacterium]
MPKPAGVFCVEGQWESDLTKRGSVLPTLEMLERLGRIRFIHRDTATVEELRYYIGRWLLRKYADYEVGFFAMHGEPTRLRLSETTGIELDELETWLAGRCEGKKLYFGSCAVLAAPRDRLSAFLDETKASMLCGFTRYVDWVEAAAFETVVLDALANGKRADSTERLMRSARWSAFARHLGFRVVYANGAGG